MKNLYLAFILKPLTQYTAGRPEQVDEECGNKVEPYALVVQKAGLIFWHVPARSVALNKAMQSIIGDLTDKQMNERMPSTWHITRAV